MPVKKIIKAVLPGLAGNAPGGQTVKRINLALQGGGAHGAFTWGVLEHLLSDDRLVIEGVSGTSSGAMNAIMLTDGLARGGRPEAQKRLTDFWRSVSSTGDLPPMQRAVVERLLSFTPVEGSTVQAWFDLMARYFSPYDFNPLNINPLKDRALRRFQSRAVVRRYSTFYFGDECADRSRADLPAREDHRRRGHGVRLPARAFSCRRDDGVPYWDGGYLGNPVIFPFFGTTQTEDVLVVQINPLVRQKTPTSAGEIMNRLNEITFNSPLIAEYRAMEFVARLIDQGRLPRGIGPGQYRRINVHRIVLDRFGTQLDASSRLTTDFDFFEMLRTNGKRAARRFLDEHFADIGVKSTVDLRAEAQAEWA
jgi:NTE family protein